MSNEQWAYIFGFSSVLSFSTASVAYTYFTHKVSPFWVNVVKNSLALFFTVSAIVLGFGHLTIDLAVHWPFLLSGIIGLNIADYCILSAFRWIGPGRTLILFGFQPLMTGTASYFIWNEQIYGLQYFSIFFFILCLFLFSFERFQKTGRWEIQGLIFAFIGMMLDTFGILLTKYGFELSPEVNGFTSHYLRELGAVASFLLLTPFVKVEIVAGFKKLKVRDRGFVVVASFLGTFMSLVFYMEAIRWGKLATVTAIVLADPMMATTIEHLWLRLWPSRLLVLALLSSFAAMFCLFYPQF